jgi:hypothetical protein
MRDVVIQSGTFCASDTLGSNDWNASIAANIYNDVFVVWNSTIPERNDSDVDPRKRVQVRFSGRLHTDPVGIINAGYPLYTSTSDYNTCGLGCFGTQRWGDYSAVTVDPTNPLRAWIVNEKVNDLEIWGSRIGQIGF